MKLQPARYDYIVGEKNQLGFIAQEVQKVIPEAVLVTNPSNGMLGLKTDFLIPYMVGAIQEQQNEIGSILERLDHPVEPGDDNLVVESLSTEVTNTQLRVDSIDTRLASVEEESVGYDAELNRLNQRLAELESMGSVETSDSDVSGLNANTNGNTNTNLDPLVKPEDDSNNIDSMIDDKFTLLGIGGVGEDVTAFFKEVWFSARVTFDNTVAFMSEVTFGEKVAFNKQIRLSKDSVGQATVGQGSVVVEIPFEEGYETEPVITATPANFIDGAYKAITERNPETGLFEKFRIEVDRAQAEEVKFNWHAFGQNTDNANINDNEASVETSNLDVSDSNINTNTNTTIITP